MNARGQTLGWLAASAVAILAAGDAIAQGAPGTAPAATPPRSVQNTTQQNSPASSVTRAPSSAAPSSPGYRVTIDSSRPFTYAWIAKGVVSTERSYPDPFTKIGRLPAALQLPSGTYTLLVEGDEVTGGSTVFEVQDGARNVKVAAGSGGLRELSGWLMAIGAAAVLAGGVLYFSGTRNDEEDRKNAISLPLVIGGGVLAVGGVSLYLVSGTAFRIDPTERQRAFFPSNSRASLALGGRW